MATTAHFYDLYWSSAQTAKVNLTSDTIKLMLVNGYTPNRGTHQYKSDVVASEVAAGNGYTSGGATITGIAIAAAGNVSSVTGANASWPSSTFSATHAVLYDSTPATDATRPLIGYVDFGGTQSPSNGTLSVTWNASGIGTVTDS